MDTHFQTKADAFAAVGLRDCEEGQALGDEELLARALAAGVSPNARREGSTLAISAASLGLSGCLRLLVKAGADLEQIDGIHRTALMTAAGEGHVECVRILLAAGANIEASNSHGWTAAMLAAAFGKADCLAELDSAGANLAKRGHRNETAASAAAAAGFPEMAALVERAVIRGALPDRRELKWGAKKTKNGAL